MLALENEQTGLYEKMCAMNGVKDNDILSFPVASSEGYILNLEQGSELRPMSVVQASYQKRRKRPHGCLVT